MERHPNPRLHAALLRCRGLMSQSEFARRLNLPRQTVSNWFTGTNSKITAENLVRLQTIFPECADDLREAFTSEGGPA